MTPCIHVYKAKIQSDGILDKIKLRIVVMGDLQNKELVGDTWSPTASLRTMNYFLVDATKHKAIVHLPRNISESSCRLLLKKYLQLIPYSEALI